MRTFTGLECAQNLTKQGLRCILLEARSRIGGRVFTDHTSYGAPVEVGAHWIHGATAKNPTKILADQLGITDRVVTKDEEILYFENGEQMESDDEDKFEEQYEKVYDQVSCHDE